MIIVPAVEDAAPAAEVVVLAPALTGVVDVEDAAPAPAPAAEVVVLAPALTGVVDVGGVVEAGDAADSDNIAIVVVQ